jgi:hypothetical protein
MGFLKEHWLQLFQTVGIIASILFTATQIRFQRENQKVANSLLVTQHHRDLWKTYIADTRLERIFQENPNLNAQPPTEYERVFLNLVFLHISEVLKAIKADAIYPIEGLQSDVRDILSYPIPRAVWEGIAKFQDEQLQEFIYRATLPNPL